MEIGDWGRMLEIARQATRDPDYGKIPRPLHALVDVLAKPRGTETSGAVL